MRRPRPDFRLVCASHRNLRDMVGKGGFREDLFYRINAFPITIPSLRERSEDVPLLVGSLLRRVEPERKLKLHPQTLALLEQHSFPGNIRELRNILEFASVMADDGTILPRHLPAYITGNAGQTPLALSRTNAIIPLDETERRYLQRVVAEYAGDKRHLAELLGVSERTLYRKIQALRDDA